MTLPNMPDDLCGREYLRIAGGYGAQAAGNSPAGGLDVDNAGNLATDGDVTVGGNLDVSGSQNIETESEAVLTLCRDSGTESDQLHIPLRMKNDADEPVAYARLAAKIHANDDGSENGVLTLQVMDDGALEDRISLSGDGTELNGQIIADDIHNNGGTDGTGAIASGTWTPTATNVANCDSFTTGAGHWMRVGNVVTFGVKIVLDATAAATFTEFRLSLPVASAFSATGDANGSANAGDGSSTCNAGAVFADLTNSELRVQTMSWSTENHALRIHGTYLVK